MENPFVKRKGLPPKGSLLRRALEYWSTFLEQVDAWIEPQVERISAILDNLSMHRAMDVLLFCLTHPRWEFVFQPTMRRI